MDEASLQLWHWIRHDRSIAYCRIESVRVEPAGSDEQVHLRLRTLETLSGPPAIEPRTVTFAQPSSERARLKSKTPVWDGVELKAGLEILYVAKAGKDGGEPLFAANTSKDDPSLAAVREIARRERALGGEPAAAKAQYLAWLGEGRLVHRLFAGQALARDSIPGVDAKGEVAAAMAAILADEASDAFLRLSLVEWANTHLWKKTAPRGKIAILRADAAALGAKDQNLRRFALDALVDLDTLRLQQEGVADAAVASLLRERAGALAEPEHAALERLAQALTPRH